MAFVPQWLLGHRPDGKPIFLRFRSSKVFIISVISFAVFTDIFLYAVIVPVVPFALGSRAGIPQEHVQYWVSILLAVYGASLFAASPFSGWLSDKTPSRRLPFLCGLLVLIGATVMLCVARSIGILVLGRILQGFSAAVVWTTGLAVLADSVGHDKIGEAMGYVSVSMSIAILIAPLLGGVVFAKGGYYAVFGMVFGILVLDVILRLVMVERKAARKWIDLDGNVPPSPQTQREDTVADPEKTQQNTHVTLLTQPHSEEHQGARLPSASADPSVEPQPSSLATISHRRKHRVPPLIFLLKSPRLLTTLFGTLVQATLFTAFDSTMPLYMRQLFSFSSIGAGLIFLPIVLPTFISPLIGKIADKHGPKWLAAGGYFIAVPFLVCLRFVDNPSNHGDTRIRQIVLLCALLAGIGAALTLSVTPLLAEMSYLVEEAERRNPGIFGAKGAYAQAYALWNMAFAAGCLVGPVWGGLIKEKAGWGTMTWTLALMSAFTGVICAVWVGGPLEGKGKVSGWSRKVMGWRKRNGATETTGIVLRR